MLKFLNVSGSGGQARGAVEGGKHTVQTDDFTHLGCVVDSREMFVLFGDNSERLRWSCGCVEHRARCVWF